LVSAGGTGAVTKKLRYCKSKPYYSTLTGQYYSDYDEAFRATRRAGGGAEVDFNLYYIHPNGSFEIVY
jgi:hypothetical protein